MRSQEEEEDWSRGDKKYENKADQFAFLKIQGKTEESVCSLFIELYFFFI